MNGRYWRAFERGFWKGVLLAAAVSLVCGYLWCDYALWRMKHPSAPVWVWVVSD